MSLDVLGFDVCRESILIMDLAVSNFMKRYQQEPRRFTDSLLIKEYLVTQIVDYVRRNNYFYLVDCHIANKNRQDERLVCHNDLIVITMEIEGISKSYLLAVGEVSEEAKKIQHYIDALYALVDQYLSTSDEWLIDSHALKPYLDEHKKIDFAEVEPRLSIRPSKQGSFVTTELTVELSIQSLDYDLVVSKSWFKTPAEEGYSLYAVGCDQIYLSDVYSENNVIAF